MNRQPSLSGMGMFCCGPKLFLLAICSAVPLMRESSSASAPNTPYHAESHSADDCDGAASHDIANSQIAVQSWFLESVPQLGEIQVSPVYLGEVFTNTRGGISTKDSTQYQGLLDLGFDWEFSENQSILPGRFYLLAQNTHGQGITTDFVGDSQVVSNIDSFQNIMQVSEYWAEFDLIAEAVTVRLGKQDINTEFLFIEMAEGFIHSTFGLSPSTAFPTFPDPSMAAVVMIRIDEQWQLKTGLWDAFAKGSSWGFSGNDSVVVIGELECSYAIADDMLPGTIAVGAVYESAGVIDGASVSSVYEYYIQTEQFIFREDDGVDDMIQGLGVFVGYYPRILGSQVLPESIGDSAVAGATYTGLLPHRDLDVLGAGMAWTELFQGGTNQETVVELFYRAQLTPRVRVQPDLQFIGSPSGIYRDSLVAGVRCQVDF